MRRREFIALLSGAAAWPLGARAQQPVRVRRVGVLMGFADDPEGQARVKALKQGVQELGWTDGRSVRIDVRWAPADIEKMQAFAKELVGLQPDVIVALGTPGAAALKRETATTPIVFVNVSDPIGSGFITSLARPGGNLTGLTHFQPTMAGKWLEILKEVAPSVNRVSLIFNPETADPYGIFVRSIEAVSASFAVESIATSVHEVVEIEQAIDAFAVKSNGGLIVLPDIFTGVQRELIIRSATRHRLPAVYPFRFFVTSGGLVSYGIDVVGAFRQAASYVDRILRGAKPSELPVQTPTKFELAVNLKAAKALGLIIPESFLLRADEVIE
jgi:putative ABC transport system substrate-binding protein